MFNIPIKLSGVKKKFGDEDRYTYDTCKKALEVRYQATLALLDLYFDSEKDKDYIEERSGHAKALLDNVEQIFKT